MEWHPRLHYERGDITEPSLTIGLVPHIAAGRMATNSDNQPMSRGKFTFPVMTAMLSSR
jgi:hypothetical protein